MPNEPAVQLLPVPDDLKGMDLSQQDLRNVALIRAAAKNISERFADPTDFTTYFDLKTVLDAAVKEAESLHQLMIELAHPSSAQAPKPRKS